MPQPFLGSSLQSFSLTRIAHPSRGRFAPLQLSTGVLKRAGRRRSPLVSPTSTLSRSCLDPRNDYGLPFHGPKSASRLPRAPPDGIASFRRLHLLRSFPPLASPFRSPPGCPSVGGRFSRVSAPPKLYLPHLGSSTRPDREGPNTRPRPKTRACDSKDRSPPCRVRPSSAPNSAQEDLVDGFQPP